MGIITLDKIAFKPEDLIGAVKSRRGKHLEAMEKAMSSAYEEGVGLLDLRASIKVYAKKDLSAEYLELTAPDGEQKIYIGPRIGLLEPAREVMIAVCTAGNAVARAVHEYSRGGDALMMYCLDAFAVRALAELSAKVREYAADYAAAKKWGVGPSMQPGSVAGWEVNGQRDLYRLAHGEKLGLMLNESCMLVPHISNSMLIGLGPHYSSKEVGSMCPECPRYSTCLWRKENAVE